MTPKRPRSGRHAQWEFEHEKDVEMLTGIRQRFADWDAREAARQARLRRWTFGILGRVRTGRPENLPKRR